MKKASKQLALLAGVFFCLATSSWSQTRVKLNVVYPAVTGVMTALWTAAEVKAALDKAKAANRRTALLLVANKDGDLQYIAVDITK